METSGPSRRRPRRLFTRDRISSEALLVNVTARMQGREPGAAPSDAPCDG